MRLELEAERMRYEYYIMLKIKIIDFKNNHEFFSGMKRGEETKKKKLQSKN
jgi:hypothetical protein